MIWLKTMMFGLPRFVWLAGGIALLLAAVAYFRSAERADDRANQTIGQMNERAASNGEAVKRVENANATRNSIDMEAARGSGDHLYAECLRAQRGDTALCQRFLPQRPAAER